MKFYTKIHSSEERNIVGICDENILGNVFNQNNIKLEIKKSFYNGELKDKEELIEILNNYDNLNLVGTEIIKLCLELELVDESQILKVDNIPYLILAGL